MRDLMLRKAYGSFALMVTGEEPGDPEVEKPYRFEGGFYYANDGAVEDQAHDRILGQRAGVPGIPIALHLRHVRLTVSLPTVPPNSAASARRTRLVLVPAR
jgi:hypothetical protein